MREYRANLIGPDGHILYRVDLICENQDRARALAKQLVDGHAVELWERGRLIERFEALH